MEKVTLSTASMGELAKSIALPKLHAPHRLPTFPNLEKTSVLSLERTTTLKVGSTGSLRCALVRSPANPFWRDVDTLQGEYMARTTQSGTTTDGSDLQWFAKTEAVPIAMHNGNYWVLVPDDDSGTCSLEIFASRTSDVDIEFTDGDVIRFKSLACGTVPIDLGINGGWWFRCCGLSTTSDTVVSVRLSADKRILLPILPAIESETSTVPYGDTRCIAAGLLVTNVTKESYKEGTVKAARLNQSTSFKVGPWKFKETDLDVAPREKYFGAMAKGFYTFCPPSSSSEEFLSSIDVWQKFSTWPTSTSGTLTVFPMRIKDCYFNAMVLTDEDVTNDTTLALTINIHLEFRTTSALFPSGFSAVSLEKYHAAQLALCNAGYFYENPMHIGAIAKVIMSGVNAALPIVGPILSEGIGQIARLLQGKLTPAVAPPPPKGKNSKKQKQQKAAKPKTKRKRRRKRGNP